MEGNFGFESRLMGNSLSPGFYARPERFVMGRGSTLVSATGDDFVDLCAGTMTNSFGHGHPVLIEGMQEAVAGIWNIHDYSCEIRATLLESLKRLVADRLDCFHFYTGGSETVEAGLRAIRASIGAERPSILSFKGCYFGKTLGARQAFGWHVAGESECGNVLLDFPDDFGIVSQSDREVREQSCLEQVETELSTFRVGAVICEPILGAGGGLNPSRRFWVEFQSLLDKYEVLLFVDEICCGFGRAGEDLYSYSVGLRPDIVSFAKGIGGGFPAMILAGSRRIMEREPFGVHGSSSTTFGGNPLSLRAMHETICLYERTDVKSNVRSLTLMLDNALSHIAERLESVVHYRCTGFLGALKMTTKDDALKLHAACLDNGVLVMTFDDIFRIAPALNISEEELNLGLDRLANAVERI